MLFSFGQMFETRRLLPESALSQRCRVWDYSRVIRFENEDDTLAVESCKNDSTANVDKQTHHATASANMRAAAIGKWTPVF
jgi:hypothetical protein